MKLYTRTGDDGTTGLFGGQRVDKHDARIAAIGAADELNSTLGLARAACTFPEIARVIDLLQPRLFDLGADLSTPHDSPHADKIARIAQRHIDELERAIDAACSPLPPMRQFILPGGTELAARLHVARCVGRRAERELVALSHTQTINPLAVVYLNRVSDLLFALARRANQLAGVGDVPWSPEGA